MIVLNDKGIYSAFGGGREPCFVYKSRFFTFVIFGDIVAFHFWIISCSEDLYLLILLFPFSFSYSLYCCFSCYSSITLFFVLLLLLLFHFCILYNFPFSPHLDL